VQFWEVIATKSATIEKGGGGVPGCARGRSQCALAAATLGPRLQPERRGGERGGEGRGVLGGGVAMLGLHVPVAWPLRQESSPLPARHVPPIKRATTSPGVNDALFSRHIATSFISLGLYAAHHLSLPSPNPSHHSTGTYLFSCGLLRSICKHNRITKAT
jgi:hypothetical protein